MLQSLADSKTETRRNGISVGAPMRNKTGKVVRWLQPSGEESP